MLLLGLSTPELLSKELHSHLIPLWIVLFQEHVPCAQLTLGRWPCMRHSSRARCCLRQELQHDSADLRMQEMLTTALLSSHKSCSGCAELTGLGRQPCTGLRCVALSWPGRRC